MMTEEVSTSFTLTKQAVETNVSDRDISISALKGLVPPCSVGFCVFMWM